MNKFVKLNNQTIEINNQMLNMDELNQYIIGNSINIEQYFSDVNPFIDLIITSPPYWDAKNYGDVEIQTGYGQTYEDYLNDIRRTFRGVYNVAKPNATLYLIIDTIKRENKLLRLPDHIANILEEIGWVHQDTMIWDKVKTLPWSRKGQSRNVFEYILMFTKHKTNYNYNIEEIKVIEPKEWWVNYPERYSPEGTVPSNIWQYPIPAQGSWGKKSSIIEKEFKHACPFPPELAARIIKLSSNEGDVVFDPYAGTGVLLETARQLNRKFLGVDANIEYKVIFEQATQNLVSSKIPEIQAYYLYQSHLKSVFRESITKLRILKYAKILIKKLEESNVYNSYNIFSCLAIHSPLNESFKNKIAEVEYYIICDYGKSNSDIITEINKLISKPPLSKYGLKTKVNVYTNSEAEELCNEMDRNGKFCVYGEGEVTSSSNIITGQEVLGELLKNNNLEQMSIEHEISPNLNMNYFPQIISNICIHKDDYRIITDVTQKYEKTGYIKMCNECNLL